MSRAPVVARSAGTWRHHDDSIAPPWPDPYTGGLSARVRQRYRAGPPSGVAITFPERGASMYPVLLLALLQHPAPPPAFPVAQVEITPATAAVEVGQKVQLSARALDAAGQPVPA